MSVKLLEEPPLLVLRSLAVDIGLNEAIALQQFYYRCQVGEVREGQRWVRMPMANLQREFPFWSESTIERTLKALKDGGWLDSKRHREGNDYTVDTARTLKLTGSITSTSRIENPQDDGSPCIKEEEGKEETPLGNEPTLPGMAPPPPPEKPKSAAQLESEDREAKVEALWSFYVSIFPDIAKRVGLTDPRRKTLRGGLKAVNDDLELCKQAARGLKAWRESHPTGSKDIAVSVVFETNMNDSRNRTEKIEWWASQAGDVAGQTDAFAHVPGIHREKVSEHVQNVNRRIQGRAMTESQALDAEASANWLSVNYGLYGSKREDGSVKWEHR